MIDSISLRSLQFGATSGFVANTTESGQMQQRFPRGAEKIQESITIVLEEGLSQTACPGTTMRR
jgi:hypothetical protein